MSATSQDAWCWHIEFVLRHCIFACLRISKGKDWKDVLEQTRVGKKQGRSLLGEAERLRKSANDNDEFKNCFEPNLLWFLGLRDLKQIVTQNWNNCFQELFYDLEAERFEAVIDHLARVRDRYAHRRPVQPAEANDAFSKVFDAMSPGIFRWTAKYWNCAQTESIERIVNRLTAEYEERYPNGLPILTEPVGGYHGGFLSTESEADRGWKLLLSVNEAESVLWIQPTAVGMSDSFGLRDIVAYGVELSEIAILVAVNFDEGFPLDVTTDGCFGLRVSFSLIDGDETLLDAIHRISELTTRRQLRPRRHVTEIEDKSVTESLTPEALRERLFYDAPPNVIEAPTQEFQRRLKTAEPTEDWRV